MRAACQAGNQHANAEIASTTAVVPKSVSGSGAPRDDATFEDPTDNATLAWSPGGRQIAFSSARDGVTNVYRQNADGTGNAERIVSSESLQMPMTFAPEKRILLSVEVPGERRNIVVAPLDGSGRTEPLVGGPSIELSGDLSSDGRWLGYDATTTGQYEVYVRPYPNVDSSRSRRRARHRLQVPRERVDHAARAQVLESGTPAIRS